jgi:two-component system cell cycle sensor histidine kinase/response regulator CckA
MWNRSRRRLDSITLLDSIDRQPIPPLQVMLIASIDAALLTLLLVSITSLAPGVRAILILAIVVILLLTCSALAALGGSHVRWSALIATGGMLLSSTIVLICTGLSNTGVLLLTFVIPITLACLLAGRRGLLVSGGVSVVILGITAILEHRSPPLAGFALFQGDNAIVTIGTFALISGILGVFLDRFGNSLQTALGALQDSHRQLRSELAERQRAEAALRASEERLHLALSATRMGTLEWDIATGAMRWSENVELLFGLTPGAFTQTYGDYFTRIHPEDRENLSQAISRTIREGADYYVEHRILWPDGTIRWIATNGAAFRAATGRAVRVAGTVRDITARKRVEAALFEADRALKEAHAQLIAILENAPAVAIQVYDANGVVTFWNRASEQLFGFRADQVLGKHPSELILSKADGKEFDKLVKLLLATNQPAPLRERSTLTKTGENRYVMSSSFPIGIEPDRRQIVCMDVDITERKRAAEALRRQNTYLTDLHETTLALLNRLDIADLLTTIVERAARLLGTEHGYLYLIEPGGAESEFKVGIGHFSTKVGLRLKPGESLAGKVWQTGQTLVGDEHDEWPDHTPLSPDRMQHAVIGAPLRVGVQVVGMIGLAHTEAGQSFSEYEIALLNGFAQLASIAFDNARLYAAVQQELTAHTQAIAALRDSEEQYRLIAENTGDLISLLDQEGRCLYASPSHRNVLGYAPVELIGVSFADFVHPEDLALVVEQTARLAKEGKAQATFRARHADGSRRWIETFWTATMQDGMHYNVAVGRDVSERKRLEAQFLQAQKMESVGQLAGGVAHDFNNLLTAILSYTELARDALHPSDPVHKDLGEVTRAARRAADLTRQLLAFARKQIIEPQVLNLNELIDDMDKLLRRLIGEDIELIIRLSPELDQVKADPGQIEQVLVNLVINARDAMPEGGKLIIETCNARFDDAYTDQHLGATAGDYVLLEVSDTGSGMNAETQRRIFEPFFTTKEPGRGTGLGLATCYGIIKQHGGYIALYSEVGLGSSFKIYLPLITEQASAAPQPEDPGAAPHGTETILLAEDELAVRMLACRVLREQGYTVIEAANGDEALQIAHARGGLTIDLLLTDIVMPKMGGPALAEELTALYPAIKVLFISGYTDSAIVHQGWLAPGVEFLQKPFSPADLARKLREVLDA